LNRKGKVN